MGKRTSGQDEGGKFIIWTDKRGQSNKKYVSGPLNGVHKWYNPITGKSGETFGVARERDGFAIAGAVVGGIAVMGIKAIQMVFNALLGALDDI